MSLFDIFKKKDNKNLPAKTIFCYTEIHMNGDVGDEKEYTVTVTEDGTITTKIVRFGKKKVKSTSFQFDHIVSLINQVSKENKDVIESCDGLVSAGCTIQINISFENKSITLDETSYTGEIRNIVGTILRQIESLNRYYMDPPKNRPARVYGVPRPNKFD